MSNLAYLGDIRLRNLVDIGFNPSRSVKVKYDEAIGLQYNVWFPV